MTFEVRGVKQWGAAGHVFMAGEHEIAKPSKALLSALAACDAAQIGPVTVTSGALPDDVVESDKESLAKLAVTHEIIAGIQPELDAMEAEHAMLRGAARARAADAEAELGADAASDAIESVRAAMDTEIAEIDDHARAARRQMVDTAIADNGAR